MCVVLIPEKRRPTDDEVERAFDANSAGAGIAWRAGGFVHWEKGIMEVEKMKELCQTTPLPYIAHFRIPTEGGKRPSLCHPFPVEKTVSLDLIGKTKNYVLFHNGHWTEWKKMSLEAAVISNTKVPVGKWSDTRAMAFVAAIYGIGILDFINEKAVAFGPVDMEVFPGHGWTDVEGLWCSNVYWKNHHTPKNNEYSGYGNNFGRMCRMGSCIRRNLDGEGYCPEHRTKEVKTAKDDKEEESQNSNHLGTMDAMTKPHQQHRQAGGAAKVVPFPLAWELLQQGKISKKQFKRSRKQWEKDLREGKLKLFPMEQGIVAH